MACPHCTKPRSPDDHRRLFGLISKAFDNWPEAHEFRPDSAEHLRAWLLCKAGYRETVTIPLESDDAPALRLALAAVEAAIAYFAARGAFAFVRPHGHALAVISAKSINWQTLDQKKFAPIREAVEEIITAETGTEASAFLKEVSYG